MLPKIISDPSPMPDIQEVIFYSKDLKKAVETLEQCWNNTQAICAMQAIEYWVKEINNCLNKEKHHV